jgi:carboxyl-terminal processing protease
MTTAPQLSKVRTKIRRIATFALACVLLAPQPAATAANLGSGLRLIQRNYLFASELEPSRLLGEALEFVERRIPEVMAERAEDGGYNLTAGPCRLFVEASPHALVTDLEEPLAHAQALIDRCVVNPPDKLPPASSLLLSGILSGLDPYSAVFDAERKTEHSIQFRGKLAGIGARIGIRDENLTLITVYEGSPAYGSGLRDKDVVRRIDGMSTTNLAVTDAVHRIRGKVGTDVVLLIERSGEDDLRPITVTRGLVTIPSVKAERLDNGVIYTSISHFSQTTPSDFRERVSKLVADDVDPKGIIIDLRTNSGGSMLGSSAIGDLLLDDALLITTAGRDGHLVSGLTAEVRASEVTPFLHYPVALLTSPRTASGSELLAASLRNNDRAIVLGERTFGKGTIQKTYSLGSDTSLKLTVGHFLPNGLAIPGGGMTPDVETRRIIFTDKRVTLPSPYLDDDPPFWLRKPDWLTPEDARNPIIFTFAEEIKEKADDAPDDTKKEVSSEPIVQLTAEVLARYGNVSASAMMASARVLLYRRSREAEHEVERFLDERGIDWKVPAATYTETDRDIKAKIKITVEDGALTAGETETLTVAVTNNGSAALYRTHATLTSKAFFLKGRGIPLGTIGPGATRSWPLEIELPATVRFGRIDVVVRLYDALGFIADSPPILLAIEESPRALLAHRVWVHNSTDENEYDITVEFENRGEATAREVKAFLRHPDSEHLELIEGTGTIEELGAGEKATVQLRARTLVSAEEAQLVDLVISEANFRLFIEDKVRLRAQAHFHAWKAPPRLELEGIIKTEDGYAIVARATDDSGIVTLIGHRDGDQANYIETGSSRPKELRITIPWRPDDEVKTLTVEATDSDGLTARFATEL